MGAVYSVAVRVIARSTLSGFVRNRVERRLQRVVKAHLDAWYAMASRAHWKTSAELKEQNRAASVVSGERVVFNIKGNEYRLVAAVDYGHEVVLVLWLGTHREYDRIDVTQVRYNKERYADSSGSH
jgi:mRNA interferase HigB